LTTPQAASAKEFDVAIALSFSVFFSIILGDPNPGEKSKSMREENVMWRFLRGSHPVKTLVTLLAVLGLWSCSRQMDLVTIGGPTSDAATLIFTAEDRHFFTTNGLNVTLNAYDTGLAAINGLLNNEIDIAGAGEYPFVVRALKKDNISIIGSFSRTYNEYLVWRTDKGIKNVVGLKGKKIGLPRWTLPEFHLGRFLDLQGMSIRDVTLINLTPARAADAIANEDVDAVVVWEPFVSQIRKQQTNGIVSRSVHSGQAMYGILVCRNDWIKRHPEMVKRVLNSLAQAEEYVVRHPAEAKAILKKRHQYDDAYVDRIWPEHQFSLSLDQSLITAMEDEARWMINNNLTKEKQVPDFLNYIYIDGLKAVKPEAANIIR
jgi:NitT/TauT family transport system substrate-binding protein